MSDTKGSGPEEGSIRGWWSRLRQGRGSPVRLNLSTDPPAAPPSPSPVKPAPNVTPDLPKPYVRFQNPNGAPLFLAHPVKFMPGRYQQNAIQPGSHDPLGNPEFGRTKWKRRGSPIG
jgi:hypothetical protein